MWIFALFLTSAAAGGRLLKSTVTYCDSLLFDCWQRGNVLHHINMQRRRRKKEVEDNTWSWSAWFRQMLIWTQTHIPKHFWCLLLARLWLVYSQVFWLFVLVWMKLQSDGLFSGVIKHKWSHNLSHMNNMSQEFALLSVRTFLLLQSMGWTQQQPTLLALSWRWARHNNWLCLSSTPTPPVFPYFWISWHLGEVRKINQGRPCWASEPIQ